MTKACAVCRCHMINLHGRKILRDADYSRNHALWFSTNRNVKRRFQHNMRNDVSDERGRSQRATGELWIFWSVQIMFRGENGRRTKMHLGKTLDSALHRNMRTVGKQSRGWGGEAPRWGSKDLWAVSNTNQASLRQHSSQEQQQQLGSGQQPGSRAANYPQAATATESLNCPARPV